jgi:hypothetical protein
VTTLQGGITSNLGWDIDELRKHAGRWIPTTSDSKAIKRHQKLIGGASGTVVCWQKLDRLLGPDASTHESDDLDSVFEKVVDHLEMVFHRFMSRRMPDGRPQLTISVNDRHLHPWDPFLTSYPVPGQVWKIEDQDIDLPSGVSSVAGFVLPTERETKADGHLALWQSAGRGRWNQLQGFYVYRLDRLITYGGYLGLGSLPDEHMKLARIAIELDNKTDNDWLLDVTKSTVTPPARAKAQLSRIAKGVRSRAVERYRQRIRTFCQTCQSPPCKCKRAVIIESVWTRPDIAKEKGNFTVNVEHSVIKGFRAVLSKTQGTEFMHVIQLISRTIPFEYIQIFSSQQEQSCVNRFDDSPDSVDLVRALVQTAVTARLSTGEETGAIRRSLLLIEPFSEYPDIVENVISLHTTAQ